MALHDLECALRNGEALKYEVRTMRETLSSRQAEAKRRVMPRRVKERETPIYIELFLPPGFDGDVMTTERININNRHDAERWHWWSAVYRGEI